MAEWLGALFATLLLTRVVNWFIRSWDGGLRRIAIVYAVVLLFCTLAGGLGLAGEGRFAGGYAFVLYGSTLLIWLAIDLWRYFKKLPEVTGPASLKSEP